MIIELAELKPAQVYFQMIQTLVPRPIAWVLSENANGSYNLAPFSYFNAISSDPPLVMLSVGKKPDGSFKDTRVNIEERGRFVIHIAHRGLLEALNASSETLDAGESELDKLGLETVPFEGSPLPRLADARIAYACDRFDIQEVGGTPQSLIIGQVDAMFIDDAITTTSEQGRLKVHIDRLDPVARLGANEYMGMGEIITLARPK